MTHPLSLLELLSFRMTKQSAALAVLSSLFVMTPPEADLPFASYLESKGFSSRWNDINRIPGRSHAIDHVRHRSIANHRPTRTLLIEASAVNLFTASRILSINTMQCNAKNVNVVSMKKQEKNIDVILSSHIDEK
jgi:hypothetical protein